MQLLHTHIHRESYIYIYSSPTYNTHCRALDRDSAMQGRYNNQESQNETKAIRDAQEAENTQRTNLETVSWRSPRDGDVAMKPSVVAGIGYRTCNQYLRALTHTYTYTHV